MGRLLKDCDIAPKIGVQAAFNAKVFSLAGVLVATGMKDSESEMLSLVAKGYNNAESAADWQSAPARLRRTGPT